MAELTKEQLEQARIQLANDPRFGEEFKDQYWSMSPEKRDAFVAAMSRDYLGETALANEQLNEADALRAKPKAKGQTVGPGNLYVGASPFQHMEDGFNEYQAGKKTREGREALKEISSAQSAANTQANRNHMGRDPNMGTTQDNIISQEEQAAMSQAPDPMSAPVMPYTSEPLPAPIDTVEKANAKMNNVPFSFELQGMQTPEQMMINKLRNRGQYNG